MKINNLRVTKKDFQDLLKAIKYVRKEIADGNTNRADFVLQSLERNLEKNLQNDKGECKCLNYMN